MIKSSEKFRDINNMCSGYNYVPTILPITRRIVAIGDIHGDYELTIKLLKIGKLIDDSHRWIGQDTVVVQVGDQIDRCRPYNGHTCEMQNTTQNDEHSDIKILKLFTELDRQAQNNIPPGRVISLLGNHELMNVQGYFDYVSHQGLTKFDYTDSEKPNMTFTSGKDAREYSFKPGNEYAKFLACTRLGAVIIGSNLFVHAGLIDKFINELHINKESDLDDINQKIRKWLLGLIEKKHVENIINGSEYSMFWNRVLGNLPKDVEMSDPRCSENLTKVLKIFKINSMVIGHTPQSYKSNDKINGTCSNKIWRIDNGSSMAFDIFDKQKQKTGITTESRKPQVLEIINDCKFRVLMEDETHSEINMCNK